MPRGATQNGRVMVQPSDRMWSMRKGMANHFSILALRTPWTVRKGNMIGYRKSLTCSTSMQSQKWKNDLCSFPRQTIQYHGNPSLCPNQKFWRSWSWMVVWRPIRPFKTKKKKEKKKKRYPFHYRGLECKSRKSRNTWSNRQIWPWNTEWSRAKANRVLPRARIGHSKHPLPTTQEKMVNTKITKISLILSLQPKMEKLYTVSKNKTRSWLWLRSYIPVLFCLFVCVCQIQT